MWICSLDISRIGWGFSTDNWRRVSALGLDHCSGNLHGEGSRSHFENCTETADAWLVGDGIRLPSGKQTKHY
jgi:hypothetical protein